MPFSRRAVLTLSLSALAAPALIRPAHAKCRAVDLDRGIAFKRKDGSKGIARRVKGGDVVIDYVTNRGAWVDQRRVTRGVFEIARTLAESKEPIVGSSSPYYSWSFSPKPIWPEDGMTWFGKVKEKVEVTISDRRGTVETERTRWTASYSCFEPREVKLSNCVYEALTVEASFVGEQGSRSQRWVYFPELSLALETRRDRESNGLVAMRPT